MEPEELQGSFLQSRSELFTAYTANNSDPSMRSGSDCQLFGAEFGCQSEAAATGGEQETEGAKGKQHETRRCRGSVNVEHGRQFPVICGSTIRRVLLGNGDTLEA